MAGSLLGLPHTLCLFNIAMGNGPFRDGLAIISMVIFNGYVSHNQMVIHFESSTFICTKIYHLNYHHFLTASTDQGLSNAPLLVPVSNWLLSGRKLPYAFITY
jgi:hypothetical protein